MQAAKAAAEEFGVEFYYQDWRPHYQEGVDISLALGLYRQPYCGCVFSERDRYMEWKQSKHGSGEQQDSDTVDAGEVLTESRPFVRITKNIIQLPKQDTILFK